MINHIVRCFPYYLILLVVLIVGDGLITNAVVSSGYGIEGSVLLSPLVGTALLATKCAGATIVAVMLSQWYYSKTRIAGFVLNTGLILYGLLFIWNAGIFYIEESVL